MKKSHVVVKRGGGFRRDSNSNTNSNSSSSMVAGNVFYKECQKNHAANIGGYAVDGCREFMASSGSNQDSASGVLACAACGCHRNFHRREVESEAACEHDDTGDSGGGH